MKLNWWAWRLVFHIIFMYHKIVFFFFPPNHLTIKKKTCLALELYKNRQWANAALGL